MSDNNLVKIVIPMLLVIGFVMGCGLLNQTGDANKLVVEANRMIIETNQRTFAVNNQLQQLLGANLASVTNVETFKKENKEKFDDLIAKFDQLEKEQAAITDKFRLASQFKLNDKYKQYLELKVQEFSIQQEATKLVNPTIKSFIETKGVDEINAQLNDYNQKHAALRQQITELQRQSNQIIKDNPTLIK